MQLSREVVVRDSGALSPPAIVTKGRLDEKKFKAFPTFSSLCIFYSPLAERGDLLELDWPGSGGIRSTL